MLLEELILRLALSFSVGYACVIFSGQIRLAIQPIIFLIAILAAHFYGEEEFSYWVHFFVLIFYVITTVLFILIACSLKKRNYKQVAFWSRILGFLFPLSNIREDSDYFKAWDCFEQGKTEEGKALLQKNIDKKKGNYRNSEFLLRLLNHEYDWLISEINKKDLKHWRVIYYKILAYGESGQLEALEDFCKQNTQLLNTYALRDRLPLLMLASYFGYRPLWDFALKKLWVKPTPFEEQFWQTTFNLSSGGSEEPYCEGISNLPIAKTSMDQSLLEGRAANSKLNLQLYSLSDEGISFFSKIMNRTEKKSIFLQQKNRQIPYFSILFFAVNLYLYFAVCDSHRPFPQREIQFGALIYPFNLHESWRFLTACFLQVTWPHFFLNMLCFIYAAWLERGIGQRRFVTLYLVSGIGAYALFVLIVQLFFPDMPPFLTYGASTSLMGVLGGIMGHAFKTWHEDDILAAKMLMIFALILWITQFVSDYFTLPGSIFLHFLGFILGFIFIVSPNLFSKQGRQNLKAKALYLGVFSVVMSTAFVLALAKEKEFSESANVLYIGGKLCFALGKKKDAIHWYLLAAKKGSPDAQGLIGYLYSVGKGLKKDKVKGFYWIEKSALQGHPIGALNLGECYWDGDGTARNAKKAFYWSEKAAQANIGFAQKRLGDAYLHGWGTNVDLAWAYYWYARALKSPERKQLKVAEIESTMRDLAKKLSPEDHMRMKRKLRYERAVEDYYK
jgi:membrane associated rhomboid family serine protease